MNRKTTALFSLTLLPELLCDVAAVAAAAGRDGVVFCEAGGGAVEPGGSCGRRHHDNKRRRHHDNKLRRHHDNKRYEVTKRASARHSDVPQKFLVFCVLLAGNQIVGGGGGGGSRSSNVATPCLRKSSFARDS